MVWGYGFTVLNYLLFCISRFCKKKYQMLTCDLLAKIALITGLYFMGSLSGAFSFVANFCWLICANIKERKGKTWAPLYVIFEVILAVIMWYSFAGISSVLVFISSTISLLSTWWLPPQKMRIAGILSNVVTLMYQLSIKNWAGLCELAVITSNFTSYLKYRKQNA